MEGIDRITPSVVRCVRFVPMHFKSHDLRPKPLIDQGNEMKSVAMKAAAILALLVTTACSDAPTAPGEIAAGTAGPSNAITLEPVIVIGKCDPYLSLDGCEGEGGDCMAGMGTDDPEVGYTSGCYSGDGRSGGGAPPGGGGAPAPITCDPQYDPQCNKPLTSADSATIRTAIARHQRPAAEFTDPARAQQCSQMLSEFNRLYTAGKVFRGGSDTQAGDPLTDTHVGAFDPVAETIHFEPSALEAANGGDAVAVRSIFNTALHESAHSLGYTHTSPIWSGSYDLYMEAPFDLLSPGANSCIKP
jgi:hypothetical protein